MVFINGVNERYIARNILKISRNINNTEIKDFDLNEFGKVYLYFMLYSFFGWVWEKFFTLILAKELREIGFLHIPVCIIYGVGAVLILFLFYGEDYSWVTIFLGCTIVICSLEFFTSWEMENLFHKVWWDYSNWICNLQGRISLISSLAFGMCGLAIVKWGHSYLYKLIDRYFQKKVFIIISFILLTVTIIDLIFTTSILIK